MGCMSAFSALVAALLVLAIGGTLSLILAPPLCSMPTGSLTLASFFFFIVELVWFKQIRFDKKIEILLKIWVIDYVWLAGLFFLL